MRELLDPNAIIGIGPGDNQPALYHDPLAEDVAQCIREDQGQVAWQPLTPRPYPPEWFLPIGHDRGITINFVNCATLAVSAPCSGVSEVAKREAPAKILAALEQAVADLRKLLCLPAKEEARQ